MSSAPVYNLLNGKVYFIEINTTQLRSSMFTTCAEVLQSVRKKVPQKCIKENKHAGWFSIESTDLIQYGFKDLQVSIVRSSPTDNPSRKSYKLGDLIAIQNRLNTKPHF